MPEKDTMRVKVAAVIITFSFAAFLNLTKKHQVRNCVLLVSFFLIFFNFFYFSKLFVGKYMLLISKQVEREEDEHIHFGNFKAFSNYILNTSF